MAISEDLSTELAAVNIILAGAGEQPVESLDLTTSSLTASALKALYEASRSLQVRGWQWNTDEDLVLSKDASSRFPLPANTLVVDNVRGSGEEKVVQRGNFLYSRTNHTYTFDVDTLRVDITSLLTWEEIPEYARQPIIYVAQRRFQMRELTSTAIDAAIKDDFDASLAMLEQSEDRLGPYNQIDDSIDQSMMGRARRREW